MSLKIVFPQQHSQWLKIEECLKNLQSVSSVDDAYKNIADMHYYFQFHGEPRPDRRTLRGTPFNGLKSFIERMTNEEEKNSFIHESLPLIAKLVLDTPQYIPPDGLSVIKQQEAITTVLSRKFVACIVATGFLCLFEDIETKTQLSMPSINFTSFFNHHRGSNQAKLKMILNYFRRLSFSMPDGDITYRRIVLNESDCLTLQALQKCEKVLCPFILKDDGLIEDTGSNTLQIDFANEFLGGGVLGGGRVQEEIRFSICPELLSSMLFMESMANNEAVIIQGFEQFSSYYGYADSLEFNGDFKDPAADAKDGNIHTALCAIDAVPYYFMGSVAQHKTNQTIREINKAFAGFQQPYAQPLGNVLETSDADWMYKLDPKYKRTVATGNWGCGAFGGDPQLKSILQWLAASYAECPAIVYFTFDDKRVRALKDVVAFVNEKQYNVGTLTGLMADWCKMVIDKEDEMDDTLFEFILKKV